MFRSLVSQLAQTGNPTEKKTMSPELRSDMYDAFEKIKAWLSGSLGSGQAGDGVSYAPILTVLQKHIPNLKMGLEAVGHVEHEVAVITGGVTNLVLEFSRWEPMAGGMAIRTWSDALVNTHKQLPSGSKKDTVAKGIARGINYNSDVSLMTQEFASKIQIVSCLKSVSSRLYGVGSDEARQSEAIWSSKLM
ncbi:hypothetical protein BKA70DRAFT_1100693 [Coprinopsis sp. MPI-PUGE-AT-0042]|nr:hypothetical protein BKA70DRAFT_1100693 [Coprinopsis sp. MPI-PUGE-AT-0042]